ncbi:MAG: hypothetical protein ABI567_10870 [Gammaproteobacteria bacterium]
MVPWNFQPVAVAHPVASLSEDLEFLLSATSLVGSMGTFMAAALALSGNEHSCSTTRNTTSGCSRQGDGLWYRRDQSRSQWH